MKRTHALIAGIIAGASLAVAAATYAQPWGGMGYGMGPGFGMGPGHGHMGGYGPGAGVDRSAAVEARLADLKARLQITSAQEDAWQAYVTQAKAQAASMQALHEQMWNNTGTAPERMAAHAGAMQQRAAGMTAMTEAFSKLYAVLTPEQQAIAEQGCGMTGYGGGGRGRRAG